MTGRFPPERRRAVLAATSDLVAERGYESTTVEAVAAATRTSKATLYRQWGDKAALVVEAVTAGGPLAIDRIDTGSLAGDLAAVADLLAARARIDVPIVLGLADAGRRDPALLAALSTRLLPQVEAVRALVGRAVERGELPAVPPAARHLPHLLAGAVVAPSLLDGPAAVAGAGYLRAVCEDVLLPALRARR
ncbi:TetR/AcrR family transcriptional regulator [Pseudonocardia spirodelae]|uniref:TetR/AcrR family transcriptional regulator n=1 Tax=Pseudonocardia spirodelae TaxID=3133431 RepID=A0ABU8T0W6_9PSEU